MILPEPVPGLLVRYSYLWVDEYVRGQEEGIKDRPCAVILVVAGQAGDPIVTVLPVSHAPTEQDLGVEIPLETKRRLGLDDAPSWIVLTEANRFVWPGPDLRPLRRGDPASIAYGLLPYRLFEQVRLQSFPWSVGSRSFGNAVSSAILLLA